MGTAGAPDTWGVGAAYEPYIGRWSRVVARAFLAWLAVPPGGRWLDVGCGTGALSETIVAVADPSAVIGIDSSEEYLAYAKAHVTDARARFEVGDARSLPVPNGTFDVVVSGLVLNFVTEPAQAVAEMARAAGHGGTVGAYVWDYADGMEMQRRFWEAAVALDPKEQDLDGGKRFAAVASPEGLANLWETAGLGKVATRAIDVPTVFRDFDDYWLPLLGGQGTVPGYIATLNEEERQAVRERLQADLPYAADGSIPLKTRAWAVRGER